MRYRTGSISLSDSTDVPLLLSIRNARALTFNQVSAIACAWMGSPRTAEFCIGGCRGLSAADSFRRQSTVRFRRNR